MASIITATTTSGLTQSADNSGVLQLASGTGNLVTVPSVTGTAMVSGNMPTFKAKSSSSQSISNATNTKLQFNEEDWDTANCYDTSNYRFTPNVAGYYQVNTYVQIGLANYSGFAAIKLYKNGAAIKDAAVVTPNVSEYPSPSVNGMVYMNGSTDYLEVYVIQNSGTTKTAYFGIWAEFSAFLARTA